MFANANRGEKSEPYDDVSIFLPYPSQWDTGEDVITVSRKCAIEFLGTYKGFDFEVAAVFNDWINAISNCL